jgi:uridine kinase
MQSSTSLYSSDGFSEVLYEKIGSLSPACSGLALYEFRYALDNIAPDQGWQSIEVLPPDEVEALVHDLKFFESIEIKPRQNGEIVLDQKILDLTRQLFVGLVQEKYSLEWVEKNFTFDTRGFNFLVNSPYLTPAVISYLGGKPWRKLRKGQQALEKIQEVGYKDFETANHEIDTCFIETVMQLIHKRGTPILLAIAGPTAAGKTEIVERLCFAIEGEGKTISSVEMDNFLTDRDQREARGIGSLGREALHFELFKKALRDICAGKAITIPRYDFKDGTSSHDLEGHLKPGRNPVQIKPADIIFVEGNAPFLYEEVADLIGIKVVYLTADAVRLKRKWRRDIDLRKKYNPFYLRNRFFKEQYIMAVKCYQPQLVRCDLFVDTTGAELWTSPAIQGLLS